MDFYSTYYKKLANYDQIKKIGEKFDALDVNKDKALNKNEFANIFAAPPTMTEEEKTQFLNGLDSDDDGFINYNEFSQTFVELDVDQDAIMSNDEFNLAKTRISELEKQSEINAQYKIVGSATSTTAQKDVAQKKIDVFKVERNVIYADEDIKKNNILISSDETQITKLQTSLASDTLLEYERAKIQADINKLKDDKDVLVLKRDIAQKTFNLETFNLNLTLAKQSGANPYQLYMITEQQASAQSLLDVEKNKLDLYNKNVKISSDEKLLTKMLVPEVTKEAARQELDTLYDQVQLGNQLNDSQKKASNLSTTRASIYSNINNYIMSKDPATQAMLLSYSWDNLKAYIHANDPAVEAQLIALGDLQTVQSTDAQISSLKTQLIDKQIQLKAVLPKADRTPYDKVKAQLDIDIANLKAQILGLGGQL